MPRRAPSPLAGRVGEGEASATSFSRGTLYNPLPTIAEPDMAAPSDPATPGHLPREGGGEEDLSVWKSHCAPIIEVTHALVDQIH